MGCVFGKEIQSAGPPSSDAVVRNVGGEGGEKDLSVPSGRKEKVVVGSVSKSEGEGRGGGGTAGEVRNGGERKYEEPKNENSRRPRGERRRSRPNPRQSNPPKHIHGEQVAAGWPSWLSAVAGEAINGWTPRRADSFEKIDKASVSFAPFMFLVFFGGSSLWPDSFLKYSVFVLVFRLDKVHTAMCIKLEIR